MRMMVTIDFTQLTAAQVAEVMALVPAERAQVEMLRAQGTLEALHLATDNSMVWLVMQGETQDAVEQAVKTLPMYPYMRLRYTEVHGF